MFLNFTKRSTRLFNFFPFSPLLDTALPSEEIDSIKSILQQYCSENMSYHNLRTRKAGNYKYIDFHLNLDEDLTVKEAHSICDRIENEIKRAVSKAEITIHVENF